VTRQYTKPSKVKQYIQRCRRNTPASIVDMLDSSKRISTSGLRLSYPYSIDEGYHPFFIIGCGRSGNTLLRKLLVENSYVAIPPELPGLGSTIRKYTQVGNTGWGEIVDSLVDRFCQLADVHVQTISPSGDALTYNLLDEIGIDFSLISQELKGCEECDRSLYKIIAAIYESYSMSTYGEIRAWGDKTPWNVFHYERIKKVFPRARYIHMLRDGRDCVASYLDSLGGLMNLDCGNAAYRWRDAVRRADKIKDENPGRFIEVRYEELATTPEREVSRIIKFLGLSETLHSTIHREMLGDVSAIHHRNLFQPVSGNSIGRWKASLSANDKKIVRKLLSDDLQSRGYEVI